MTQGLFAAGLKELQFGFLAHGESIVALQHIVPHQRGTAVNVSPQLIQQGIATPGFLSERGARHG